ncbi:MAG: hypothetical protein UX68_C0043G0006 [Parcubacteria group bacterium GW2011_GWA2_46_9]|nr:MAG: hypothetical protein UX68_C0043G0006 [Parcubacteria group bacterium GW2011_GWA2_46_9]
MPISALSKPKNLGAKEATISVKTLTPPVQAFLANLSQKQSSVSTLEGPYIHVSSVISGAAALYEKLRYSLDYREEHLLRRHAIERIVRRQLEDRGDWHEFARPFLIELVQAQYLRNDSIPEAIVPKVQTIFDRYAVLFNLMEQDKSNEKKTAKAWLLGLLSAELDDELAPSPEHQALVNLMVSYVIKDDPLMDWSLGSEEKERQVFIACYRALFAFDPQTLHFFLLLKQMPDWRSRRAEDMSSLWPSLSRQYFNTEQALRHPAGLKLYRALKSRVIVFHALKDIAMKYPGGARELLLNEPRLRSELEEICQKYYRGARRRLYRSAVRATVYIFLTKIILALIAEAPAEQFIYGAVLATPIVINTVFPPSLMFLLTATTRFPGRTNTREVVRVMIELLYGGERRVFSKVKNPVGSSVFLVSVFSLFYLLTFTITFGGIILILHRLHFTFIGTGFFLLFLTVVSFFAIRIRQPVRDLFVSSQRENILLVLINFFSLPILRVGQFVSLTSAKFNVFLYLFDYLLEAPFKSFLIVFEDVLGFFREQREDIV